MAVVTSGLAEHPMGVLVRFGDEFCQGAIPAGWHQGCHALRMCAAKTIRILKPGNRQPNIYGIG